MRYTEVISYWCSNFYYLLQLLALLSSLEKVILFQHESEITSLKSEVPSRNFKLSKLIRPVHVLWNFNKKISYIYFHYIKYKRYELNWIRNNFISDIWIKKSFCPPPWVHKYFNIILWKYIGYILNIFFIVFVTNVILIEL